MTPEQRSLAGRIGSAIQKARHDPAQLTAAGRATFLGRFEREVREQTPDLSDAEVMRRAALLRKAYMARLALASSIARRHGKAVGGSKPKPSTRSVPARVPTSVQVEVQAAARPVGEGGPTAARETAVDLLAEEGSSGGWLSLGWALAGLAAVVAVGLARKPPGSPQAAPPPGGIVTGWPDREWRNEASRDGFARHGSLTPRR